MFRWFFGGEGDASGATPPPLPPVGGPGGGSRPPTDEELKARLASGADAAAGEGALNLSQLGTFDPTVLERIAAAARELQGAGEGWSHLPYTTDGAAFGTRGNDGRGLLFAQRMHTPTNQYPVRYLPLTTCPPCWPCMPRTSCTC